MKKNSLNFITVLLVVVACGRGNSTVRELLNVSYDPTREFYRDFNEAFEKHWKSSHPGDEIRFRMSHGGSGKQARAVIDGLAADVVTLALASDIDAIARAAGLLPADWQKKLPQNGAPYVSTIVFLVRKGNPKALKDWNDLVRPGVSVITPNPKTSGGARWNYLAAFAYGAKAAGKSGKRVEDAGEDFLRALFKNVAVLDTGARGATTTFTQRQIGDVLIAWENEAYSALKEKPGEFEVVAPPSSILAEPVVALIEANSKEKGTTEIAQAYLQYLYSDEGQNLAGKHFFRPRKAAIAAKFPHVRAMALVTIDAAFGGWDRANREHFADGGLFDRIYRK